MSENLSGREIAAKNLKRFMAWIAERDAACDWSDYVRGDKLNRTEVAAECGFALSVLRQNPAIKEALGALETRLKAFGVLGVGKLTESEVAKDASSLAYEERFSAAKAKAERRIKTLEEHNAALRAEVQDLREQLRRYKLIDDHLCRTGRLLQP